MSKWYGKLTLVLPGGQEKQFLLSKSSATLGRSTTSDVVIPDVEVSRQHARLVCDESGCQLTDLRSVNGTFVNGRRIERAEISPTDVISLGNCTLRYHPVRVDGVIAPAGDKAKITTGSLLMILADTQTPRLAVYFEGRTWEIPLEKDAVVIGRDPEADVRILHGQVSREHARIERVGNHFVLRDLHSRNGTWIGLRRIEEYTLQTGDMFRIGEALLVFKGGFSPEDPTWLNVPTAQLRRERRPVVIVPGIVGSELWLGSECVWPNVGRLLSDPAIFRLKDGESVEPLEARGLVGELVILPNLIELEQYDRLGDFLEEDLGYERGKDLLEFAYDWRLDNRISARRLAEVIDEWDVEPPVALIAHSMGGLVARYYVDRLGGDKKVGRLILVGGPNKGAPMATVGLIAGLDVLPFTDFDERVSEVMRTFPSVYQLLPTYPFAYDRDSGEAIDLLADERWLDEACRPLLHDASVFSNELAAQASVPSVSVFGYGVQTPVRADVSRTADGKWHKFELKMDEIGDNTVLEGVAVLPGSLIHPVYQHHGALYVDNEVKTRLALELMR